MKRKIKDVVVDEPLRLTSKRCAAAERLFILDETLRALSRRNGLSGPKLTRTCRRCGHTRQLERRIVGIHPNFIAKIEHVDHGCENSKCPTNRKTPAGRDPSHRVSPRSRTS